MVKTHGFTHFALSVRDPDVSKAGQAGGVMHFGFPFAFIHDPDGYEVEIWFE
jgi:hypothetical protein